MPKTSDRLTPLLAAAAGLVALLATAPVASADRDFSTRFSTQAPGNITMASNTLMTCGASQSGCAAAQNNLSIGLSNNSSLNNNSWIMVNLDVDSDPSTAVSSAATLTLPAGADVIWAGLYWTASAPSGLTANQAKAAKFMGPDGVYRDVTATVYDAAPSVDYGYDCFLNVTSEVQRMGAGSYMLGGIPIRSGVKGTGAGWSLVVAYQAPGEPLRDLSVFDGQRTVGTSSMISIPISGFRTPASGSVKSDVGLIAFEGDRGITGDYAQLNDTVLTDAVTPQMNFFNAWISYKGAATAGRNPNQGNQFGFDAKVIAADGVLGNNATSAVIRAKSSGEAYQPLVATFATELYAPNLVVKKTVKDLSGGEVRVNDELEYTLTLENTGGDGAVASDLIEQSMPAGTTFVPGSVTYDGTTVPDSGGRAAAAGGTGSLAIRLGADWTSELGGLIAPGEKHTIKFKVKVTDIPPGGGIISNTATIDYTAQTLGTPVEAHSPKADIAVRVPNAAITKTITSSHFANGLAATYRISVKNVGTSATSGTTTVTDQLPAAFSNSPTVTAPNWTCGPIVAGLLSCSRSDALAAGSTYDSITVSVASLNNPSGSTVSNTASVTTPLDGDSTNDSSTASQTVGAGLSVVPVSVQAQKLDVYPAETVAVTGDFTNNGPSIATNALLVMESNVSVDEVPATGFTVTSSDGSVTAADCTASVTSAGHYRVECSKASLKAGVTVVIKINFRPSPNTLEASFDVTGTSSADNWASGPATSTETVGILPTSDLQVVKTSASDNADPGGIVVYRIDVTNNGPRAAGPDVQVTDVVPVGMDIHSAGWSDDQSNSGSCTLVGLREVNCASIPGPLQPASGSGKKQITVTVVARVDNNASGHLENCASASTLVRDPDPSNDTSCHSVIVSPWAELGLTKLGPTSMKPGGTGTFNLVVTNYGPTKAWGIKVIDDLPIGLSPVGPLPDGCTAAGQRVTCDVGLLTTGSSKPLSITARASSSITGTKKLKNVARATSETPGNSAEASDIVPIVVASAASTGVTTSIVGPRTAKPVGSIFNLKVSIKAGGSTARNSSLCATLPGNVSYLSSTGSRSGNRVCWRTGTIKDGASKSYSIQVMATASGARTASSAARATGTPRATASTTVRVYGGFTG